jgi:hypothetical protein
MAPNSGGGFRNARVATAGDDPSAAADPARSIDRARFSAEPNDHAPMKSAVIVEAVRLVDAGVRFRDPGRHPA